MGNKLVISDSGSFSLDSSPSSLQAFYQQPLHGRANRRNSSSGTPTSPTSTKRFSGKEPLSGNGENLFDNRGSGNNSPNTTDYNILVDELSNNAEKKRMNVIMLGTGGSAKTSVLKQLKLMGGKREDLIQSFWQEGIVVPCFDLLVSIFNRKNFYYPNAEYRSEESDEIEQQVFDIFEHKKILNITHPSNEQLVEGIVEMWNNEPILRKVCTEMLLENQVESVPVEDINYYFSRAVAVHKGDKPSDKDLMISQRKTTGVTHVQFAFNNVATLVNIWDCGGQKNERKKWKYMFSESEKLSGKIFMVYFVALSEYNQLCYEDESTNRTHESLNIFESIANNPAYQNYPLFLIFTKKDIFKQKLRYTSLSVCFEDCPEELKANEDTTKIKRDIINNWTGFLEDRQCVSEEVYEKALEFVKGKFMDRISSPERRKQTEPNIKVINAMDCEDVKSKLVEELLEQTMVEYIYKDDMTHYL